VVVSAADLATRRFLIDDENGVELALEVTWDELAVDNEPETMEAIADIALNEDTILGMCDRIKRIA
jgi:predicted metal-dependent HD superfamily phosphohydrolase